MASGLLMAILAATIALPLWAPRDPRPARGRRRAVVLFALFVAAWAQARLHIFPSLAILATAPATSGRLSTWSGAWPTRGPSENSGAPDAD